MQLQSNTTGKFTPDAGEVPPDTDVLCGVCKEKMNEQRGLNGPRTSAEAMAKHKSDYDQFTCPCLETNWHQQVVALRKEINETASYSLRNMLEQEVSSILNTRTPTIVKRWHN